MRVFHGKKEEVENCINSRGTNMDNDIGVLATMQKKRKMKTRMEQKLQKKILQQV
jgi:hypothetical protein